MRLLLLNLLANATSALLWAAILSGAERTKSRRTVTRVVPIHRVRMSLLSIIYGLFLVLLPVCWGQSLLFENEGPEDDLNNVRKVRQGDSIVLDCEAGGSPSPTLHWLYNGERLPIVSIKQIISLNCSFVSDAEDIERPSSRRFVPPNIR